MHLSNIAHTLLILALSHPHAVLGSNPNPNPKLKTRIGSCASTTDLVIALIIFMTTKHTSPLEALMSVENIKNQNNHHHVFVHDEDKSARVLTTCSILIPTSFLRHHPCSVRWVFFRGLATPQYFSISVCRRGRILSYQYLSIAVFPHRFVVITVHAQYCPNRERSIIQIY